jgi:hypothetical protein
MRGQGFLNLMGILVRFQIFVYSLSLRRIEAHMRLINFFRQIFSAGYFRSPAAAEKHGVSSASLLLDHVFLFFALSVNPS